jgi:hypothetical protein
MKAASFSFGYAALDWCCDEGNASLPSSSDDQHAPLHSADRTSSPQKRRRGVATMDSSASASTASTQDDVSSTEPLIVDPIWEPHAAPRVDLPAVPSVEWPPLEWSGSDLAERALGPIDLDALEEEATEMVPHPSSSQESTLGSLNTNASAESRGSAQEKDEAPDVIETPAVAAAATISESPTDVIESSHVVEDPLLLLLLSQGPERSEKRDPSQLDALLQNILQDDEATLASSTAQTQASGDLMDTLAAGPVDVDDFIPEDSYWSMNTQDFVLDEVELSRQLAGYQEGCEPPCIDRVVALPRITRQRTAATAETSELWRRAHVMQQARRPDVVRRHVTAPSATRPNVTHSGVGRPQMGVVRPNVTHPGVGRPQMGVVRPNVTHPGVGRPQMGVVRPNVTHPTLVRRPQGGPVQPMQHTPPRIVPPQSPPRIVLPPALRKERRWLPESAAEV